MGEEYILNRQTEVVPVAADRYELRVPLWGRSSFATEEQLAILRRFESWTIPNDRELDRDFVQSCVEAGVLLTRLPSGKIRAPQTVRVEPTMFGAPHREPNRGRADVTFLGVPFDSGGSEARIGPTTIRRAAETCRYTLDPTTLEPRGFLDLSSGRTLVPRIVMEDAGDVFVAPGEDPQDTHDRITDAVRQLVEVDTKPLILGGDHSITYPVLRAFPESRIGIIHFDAQTALHNVLERLEFVERIHQIGLRGLQPAGLQPHPRELWYGVDRVRSLGAVMLVESLPSDLPYYLSIDIRVLDPSFAPTAIGPIPNGLHPHELKAILRVISASRDVVGMDVVGVGRPISSSDASAHLAVEALLTVANGVRAR